MKVEFTSPTKCIFGSGEFGRLAELLDPIGKRIAIVTGAESFAKGEGHLKLEHQLKPRLFQFEIESSAAGPTFDEVDRLVERFRPFDPDAIVAIGGGSIIDLGKALSVMLTHAGSVGEYAEGAEEKKKFAHTAVPLITIPTTASTGAEVTCQAFLRSGTGEAGKWIKNEIMRPKVALVDPSLGESVDAGLSAAMGLSVQAQLIEAFTSRRSRMHTDGQITEGLTLVSTSIESVYYEPLNHDSREKMAFASMISGIAVSNVGLGPGSELAAALASIHGLAHSIVYANLLPELVGSNLRSEQEHGEEEKATIKYREVARILTGDSSGDPGRLVTNLRLQRRSLKIPSLGSIGLTADDLTGLTAMCRPEAMASNPVYLDEGILRSGLTKLLE